jgi:hypothetical protein
MDPTAAGNRAVALLSQYLNSRFAGAQPAPALDSLYQLVAARLGASQSGQQALQAFSAAHHDPGVQARFAAAITQEASLDWNFLSALTQATGDQPATHTMTAPAAPAPAPGYPAPAAWPAGPAYPGTGTGMGAGAAPRSKLTPGWIAAIVAGAAVVLIAIVSIVVVIATSGGAYDEIAGTWVPEPGSESESSGVLRITEDGEWTLEVVSLGGTITCAGEVEGNQPPTYTLRAEQGVCTTVTARLEGDDVLVLSFPETPGDEERLIRG